MTENTESKDLIESKEEELEEIPQPGPISQFLSKACLEHNFLEPDNIGIEVLSLKPESLIFLIALSTSGCSIILTHF